VIQVRSTKATIDDVARAAGVSRATVSRFLNGRKGVSWTTRQRVLKAAKDLGYHPNETARALATGKPRAVHLVAIDSGPDFALGAHPYYSRVLAGAITALETANVQLHTHTISEHRATEHIDAIAASPVAGVILANVTPDLALRFHRRCRNVVSLVPTAPAVPTVEADNIGGAFHAVEHLHALGRRRIAAIHGPAHNTCAIDRRIGYQQATQALELADINAEGGFSREGGHAAALRLLDEHPDIDAIFVACDLTAAGVIHAITTTGRHVPHDICVIGFDDSYIAICNNPTLTTIRLPIEEMATTATQMLLSGTIQAGHRRRFPVELIQRDSTTRHPIHRNRAEARETPQLHVT
jgi:DNA-binding LacI/PurR family transcriptional regulator